MTKNRRRKQRTSKRSQRGGDGEYGDPNNNGIISTTSDAAKGAFDAVSKKFTGYFSSPETSPYQPTQQTPQFSSTGGKKHKKKRGGSRKRKCKTRKRKTRKH